ncbi:MAG: M6 family metalloprotease domain-containing protein [Acidobacteria bacterium]|nr:M6 family metalloprotease domain-containing protein [Acidobacteriota bacterium]
MTRRNRFLRVTFNVWGVILGLCLSGSVLALYPPTAEQWEQMRRDGTLAAQIKAAYALGNHRADPARVLDAQRRLNALLGIGTTDPVLMSLPPGRVGMPTKGNVKVLAILIDFQGTPHITADTPESFVSKLYGDGDPVRFPYESLRNFYRRASYNQLEVQGSALGWYTTTYPRTSVTQTTTGRQNLIKEALNYFNAQGHDFTQYDNDGDGEIDYLMVFWAGGHGAWASFWWAYQTHFYDQSFTLDGKKLGRYSWQWESSTYPNGAFQPHTVIHETGHALGLPDYYDYDDAIGPSGGVGGLDMMDGNWGDHNCYSKFLLGWNDPVPVFAGQTGVSLRSSATFPDALFLIPGNFFLGPFAEFFMVQNRYREANDTPYPTNGLVVWHVDGRLDPSGSTFAYDNSYTAHKMLRLMEADGNEDIESGAEADAGDFYTQGSTIGPATTPNTSLYADGPLRLGVRNISASGAVMTFDVFDVFSDMTPPTGVPGTPTLGASSSTSSVTFNWVKGTEADPESGIAAYHVQVGTTPGGNDKYDGYARGTLTHTIDDCENGKTYYARVRAVNGNGLGGTYSANSPGKLVTLPTLSGTAVERSDLTFSLSGDDQWSVSLTGAHTGPNCFKSSSIMSDEMKCSVYTTLAGPGTLSFWWKVSSEAGYDFVTFELDGTVMTYASGEVDWTRKSFPISRGDHFVKWTYAKDEGVTEGQDTAWIDEIAVTATATIGDLDQSLDVTTADMVILANALAGNVTPGGAPFYASAAMGDLDQSGGLGAGDLVYFQAWLAGNALSLPD